MPKTIRVVGIGAGNIAHHLIPALKHIGCDIVQIYSRSIKNARKLSSKVDALAINKLTKIADDADFYLIMIADDAIKEVAEQLPQLDDKQFIAHTSGSTPISVLKKTASSFGSFYPLQSFRKDQKLELSKVPFLVCGNTDASKRFFRALAKKLSTKVSECEDIDRLRYHMAAVFANNFTNHLACVSSEILSESKLDPKILKPIMASTYERILKDDACKIQTGPALRGDLKTQKKHHKLLKDNPEWKSMYQSISKSIKSHYEDSE